MLEKELKDYLKSLGASLIKHCLVEFRHACAYIIISNIKK